MDYLWAGANRNAAGGGSGGSGIVIIRFKGITIAGTSGGSGGGSFSNLSTFQPAGSLYNSLYSYATSGSNGTLVKGGDGGSALSNVPYTSLITGSSYQVGQGGTGAGLSTTPSIRTIPGSGGDGNGGVGTNGIVIIKVPLDTSNIKFDGVINASNILGLNLGISGATDSTIREAYNDLNNAIIQTSNNLLSTINYNKTWNISNTNIFNSNSGNVGIGTNNPTSKLHLVGNLGIAGDIIPINNSNFNLGSLNNRWKDLYLAGNSINLGNLIISRNNSNNLEIRDNNNNFRSINASSIQLNDGNNYLSFNLSNGQLIYNSNGSNYPAIKFQDLSQVVYSNQLISISNAIISYTINELNKTRDVIEEYSSSGPIIISKDNTSYSFNYESKIGINKGTYEVIFNNSNIIFNGITDNSYPILKDSSGLNINPSIWYKFDNSSIVGLDSSENGYNLTNNGVTIDTNSKIRGIGAANFVSANNQYLSGSGFNFNNKSFTISLWANPTSISGNWIYGVNSTNQRPYLGFYTDKFWFDLNSSGNTANLSLTSADLNIWQFYSITYNFTTNVYKIYKNGILEITYTSLAAISQSSYNFEFGRIWGNNTYCYNGKIDDFRIYSQELSQNQINELYKGRLRVYYPYSLNADMISSGTSNRLITNDTYSRSITFTSNVNVLGNYQLNGCNIPFSLMPYTTARSFNGTFAYNSSSNNFGYYSFTTSGSINFTKQTSCELLIKYCVDPLKLAANFSLIPVVNGTLPLFVKL